MKGHRLPLLIIALALVAVAPAALGQTFADLTAQANLQASYTVTAGAALDFGDVVPSAVAGTVTITSDGAGGVRTFGGGVTAGTPALGTEGSFDVNSNQALNLNITIANGVVSDGTNTMTVNTINRFPATANPFPFPIGITTISVGGVLNVGANQPLGAYNTANPGGTPILITVLP